MVDDGVLSKKQNLAVGDIRRGSALWMTGCRAGRRMASQWQAGYGISAMTPTAWSSSCRGSPHLSQTYLRRPEREDWCEVEVVWVE